MQRLRLIPSRHNKASGRGCRFCRSLQDDNLVIYNGWGTADCDRIPLDTQLNLTFAGLLDSFWVKKDSLLGAAISFSGVLCLVFVSRSPGLGAQTKHRLSVCFRINSLSVCLMDQPCTRRVRSCSEDRDYSGCPCRSWNGIVEYRCEATGSLLRSICVPSMSLKGRIHYVSGERKSKIQAHPGRPGALLLAGGVCLQRPAFAAPCGCHAS